MTSRNEAAEQLAAAFLVWRNVAGPVPVAWSDWLSDALAAERRATVERLRKRLLTEPLLDGTPIGSSRISAFNVDIAAILDEEAL